jgi:chromate transporter
VGGAAEVFSAFLRLGLTAFGGPVAHLGHFRRELVARRRWLDDAEYADTVALCQSLPGPTSSQVGFAIGLRRAGIAGGVAAWLGFTLPGAAALGAAGWALAGVPDGWWTVAVQAVAAAVVANALLGMARMLLPTAAHAALATAAMVVVFAAERAAGDARGLAQPAVIAAGAIVGSLAFRGAAPAGPAASSPCPVPRAASALAALLFVGALALPPLAAGAPPAAQAAAACTRAGSLVFGGGHVVLPLLEAPFESNGWLAPGQVTAGYALAQAVPGPLFSMASYLGAAMGAGDGAWHSAGAAALLTAAIFLPGLLLVVAALPAWDRLRAAPGARAALAGANCAVVGLLAAALADLALRLLG